MRWGAPVCKLLREYSFGGDDWKSVGAEVAGGRNLILGQAYPLVAIIDGVDQVDVLPRADEMLLVCRTDKRIVVKPQAYIIVKGETSRPEGERGVFLRDRSRCSSGRNDHLSKSANRIDRLSIVRDVKDGRYLGRDGAVALDYRRSATRAGMVDGQRFARLVTTKCVIRNVWRHQSTLRSSASHLAMRTSRSAATGARASCTVAVAFQRLSMSLIIGMLRQSRRAARPAIRTG